MVIVEPEVIHEAADDAKGVCSARQGVEHSTGVGPTAVVPAVEATPVSLSSLLLLISLS